MNEQMKKYEKKIKNKIKPKLKTRFILQLRHVFDHKFDFCKKKKKTIKLTMPNFFVWFRFPKF